MIFAVVPANGTSTRMGRPKLILPLGDSTVIERVVTTLRAGGVDTVLVIAGPHVPELAPLATKAGAYVLSLPNFTNDMRTTVEKGLDYLEEQFQPGSDDPWLLSPADHPVFSPDTVRQLLAAAVNPSQSILTPVNAGRRGHPTLLRWRHVGALRSLPIGTGFNTYLRLHPDEICDVEVSDPGVLMNLTTPEDYERLRLLSL
jgi:molybdenum cofactor cytidylyltransferase